MHHVPIQVDYSDLYDSLAFLGGGFETGGDGLNRDTSMASDDSRAEWGGEQTLYLGETVKMNLRGELQARDVNGAIHIGEKRI